MTTARKCIKCGRELSPMMVEEVEVDRCGGCGGLWLDRGEIRALAEKSDEALLALCAPSPEKRPGKEARSTVDPPCPACGGKLTLAEFEVMKIERCSGCHGIFLDRGELEQAISILRERGDRIATVMALARSVATRGVIDT